MLDLNLLVTLDAVLREGSVTGAARALGLGQPAVSHALGRLRDALGEPLFVRSGRGIVPTARADAMRGPLARLLADARRLVEPGSSDALAQTRRQFRLRAPDLLGPALPELVEGLSAVAPKATLEVIRRGRDDADALERGETDLVVGVERRSDVGLQTRTLGRLRFVVVARATHPALARRAPLSTRGWTSFPHIVVRSGSASGSLVGDALGRAGLDRHVGLVVPSFLAALVTTAHTDHLFTAPGELVAPLLDPLGLTTRRLPVALDPVPVAAFWHARAHEDPHHRAFRDLVAQTLRGRLSQRIS